MSIVEKIYQNKKANEKSLALLIDPDKVDEKSIYKLVNYAIECKVSYIFIGGSLMTETNFSRIIGQIKELTSLPVIIFPGSNMHIDNRADGILFLSLISGRNPELLIGQQVVAAPILKNSGLEILPTGYMLIDGGKPTTASYMSGTQPIPANKPEIAACTALAGEMLGLKFIYLDAGSGAENPVSPKMIHLVSKSIDIPVIVGGGINTVQKLDRALAAGADIVVIGNQIEKDPDFLIRASEKVRQYN